jgi:glycine cleavage system H protein
VNPQDLLYNKTHEWVAIADTEGGKVATIGISAFAIEQLTDLVYLDLPQVGRQVEAGQSIGEVESVKAVSDLYSPVSGEIIEVNSSLPDNLESLNSDPYDGGWIAKIKISDESSLSRLLDFAAYQKQCEDEG